MSVDAPEDLAGALPHLLGFPPVESLVLVALQGPRGELTFTLRLDLPGPDDLDAVAEMCAARMEAATADAVVAFVVTEAPEPANGQLPGTDLVEALQRAADMPLRDAFLLRGDRMWSYVCTDPRCCPAEGRRVRSSSPVATTLAASAVVAGRPLFGSRDEIVRAAQAVGGAQAEAVVAAVDRLEGSQVGPRYRRELPGLLARAAEGDIDLSVEEAALVGWAWHDVRLRDDVLRAVATGVPGADTLVRAIARLVPAPYDAPAATVLGWAAYAEGSGVLAAAAFERALATDPGYSLARLLDDALYQQLPPSALRAVWAKVPVPERGRPARGRWPRA
ncbi:MAG: DUF4192 domain-containing protein [Frankiales bacterium]|nr:DUF4192 domain-containing protein [Frankiales bacterium]